MIKFKYLYIASFIVLLGFSSCNDWLDVQPKTELKQEELFTTEQGFEEALRGAYVSMTDPATYGREMTIGTLSVMGADYSVASSSQNANLYLPPVESFNYEFAQLKSAIGQIWVQQYNGIALLNNILEQIDNKRSVFSNNSYNRIKGEALALRAYLHFDLMRMFAPSYLHKDDKAYLPYVKQYGRENTPLSGMEEYVGLLLKDIEDAEVLLKDDVVTGLLPVDRKIRMNRVATKGLKARVMLYIGNTGEAHKLAMEIIDAKEIQLRQANYDIRLDRTIHSEHLFSLYSDKFEERVLELVSPKLGIQTVAPYYFTTEDKLKNEIFLGKSTDIRYKEPMMLRHMNVLAPHKFIYPDVESTTRGVQRFYIPLMKVSEMYYIAAETAPTKEEGIRLLNLVTANRGLLPLPNTADLNLEIQQEYRKEFFTEGQTFFYYKRLATRRIAGGALPQMTKEDYVFPMPEDEVIYGSRN
ncbi:MAG: RagB/SusD family nutrient uptake outer membrane protein [Sphingobacterium sp.]|jgi:hypothetical protein|nr:RagB/SusD family nutrient uptake outer membrane protein [Sphingobacterium sp.]